MRPGVLAATPRPVRLRAERPQEVAVEIEARALVRARASVRPDPSLTRNKTRFDADVRELFDRRYFRWDR
jgi:hypothetical protein